MNYPALDIPGVHLIRGNVYVASEEALAAYLAAAAVDYDIEDCNVHRLHRYDAYSCKLNDKVFQSMVKCDLCGGNSSHVGCKLHGFKCSHCGETLYEEIGPGAVFRFQFEGQNDLGFHHDISLTVHRFDLEGCKLYFLPDYVESTRWFAATESKYKEIMEAHAHLYERVTLDGKEVLAFHYDIKAPSRGGPKSPVFNLIESTHVGFTKYKHLSVFKGVEYEGDGLFNEQSLPQPRMFTVYPEFRRASAPGEMYSKLCSVAGIASHRLEKTDVTDVHIHKPNLDAMRTYIQFFTGFKVEAFDEFVKTCRVDGTGFVHNLAAWIEKQGDVRQNLPYDEEYRMNRDEVFKHRLGKMTGCFRFGEGNEYMEDLMTPVAIYETKGGKTRKVEFPKKKK